MNRMIWAAVVGAGAAAIMAYKNNQRNVRLAEVAHQEDLVNQAIDDSFPASDPPSSTPIGGSMVNGRDFQ